MNNTYSILWFDDNERSQKAFQRRLRRQLKQLGFGLAVEFHKTVDVHLIDTLCAQMRIYNQFDLIMFDHKLEGGTHGAKFAAEFRKHKIFTDMVYYSSSDSDTLWSALRRMKVDGVYVLNREGMDNDLIGIVEGQISRVFDVSNMRGFILQFMSQVEGQLRVMLLDALDKSAPNAGDIVKIIAKGEQSIAEKKIEKMGELTKEDCPDLIMRGEISFDRVRSVLAEITPNAKDYFGEQSLLLELQRIRNMFAHRRHWINPKDNKLYLQGDKTHPHGYSSEDFKTIRIKTMQLSDELRPFFPHE